MMNQSCSSHQDVGIADELTLPTKLCIDIGRIYNDVISQRQYCALAAALLEGGELSGSRLGFQSTEDLIARDNRERETAIGGQVSSGLFSNMNITPFHDLGQRIRVEQDKLHSHLVLPHEAAAIDG